MALARSSPFPGLLYRATHASVFSNAALAIKGTATTSMKSEHSVNTDDSLNLPFMAALLLVISAMSKALSWVSAIFLLISQL
jgi:hypothetical protein